MYERRLSTDELLSRHEALYGRSTGRLISSQRSGIYALEARSSNRTHRAPPCDVHRFNFQLSGYQTVHEFDLDDTTQTAPCRTTPGTVSFVPAGRPLNARMGGDDFHAFQVLIPRQVMRRSLHKLFGSDLDDDAMSGHIGAANNRVFRIAQLLHDEYRDQRDGDAEMVDHLVNALSIELARQFGPSASQSSCTSGLSPEYRARVVDLMQDAVDGSMRLSDIADALRMEPYRLSRIFKATFGETPRQYLLRLRLDRARHLVVNTETALAEVALDCGFSSQSHMTTAFTQHFGQSPARLRASKPAD